MWNGRNRHCYVRKCLSCKAKDSNVQRLLQIVISKAVDKIISRLQHWGFHMKVKVTIRNEWKTPMRISAFGPLSTKVDQEAGLWAWAVAEHKVQTNVLQTSEAPHSGPNITWHWCHCFAFFLSHMQSIHMIKTTDGAWPTERDEKNKGKRNRENQSQRRTIGPGTVQEGWSCGCSVAMLLSPMNGPSCLLYFRPSTPL